MKKGFTLVELLIVVVVLVTLMSIVFRIGNIGWESERRTITIQRIQRMENALSGYYAAFGMYPPVRIHGSRNMYLAVDANGLQSDNGQENTAIWGWVNADDTVTNWEREREAWRQVEAACRSQPVGCEFPFATEYRDLVQASSEEFQMWASQSENMPEKVKSMASAGFDDGVTQNINRHSKNKDKIEWQDIQLFKFGVLSYLLPRYLVMMNGDQSFFTEYAQWTGNNIAPSDPLTGSGMNWRQVRDYAQGENNSDIMHVANIPSQAVCARWMACFENALACNAPRTLFGVQIRGDEADSLPRWHEEGEGSWMSGRVYNPNGWGGSSSGNYILDCITMRDGWWNDLYYYSPAPYQSYTLWSSGPNGRTFPPWVSRDKLPAEAQRCAAYWTKDDIVGLRN